jgi:hypothetical protein
MPVFREGSRPLLARTGTYLLAAVVAAAALHLWLAGGVLVPVTQSPTSYLFVAAGLRRFVEAAGIVAAVVLGGHALVRRVSSRRAPAVLLSADDVRYLSPLLWLSALSLELLLVVPRTTDSLSVLSYVLIDLHWWWGGALVLWTLFRLNERLGGAPRSAASGLVSWMPVWFGDAALVAIAGTWVIAGTPTLRFAIRPGGDEPKYVRYCENIYQGYGFEISGIQPLARLGPNYHSHIWRNVGLVVETVPRELRALALDAVGLLHGRLPARTSVTGSGSGFIVGKDGGLFQLHSPGLSLMMFPAYYLDRRFSGVPSAPDAQWPDSLLFVSLFLLGLYLTSTVLVYRIARRYSGLAGWSWALTLAIMLSLPVAAFPFQVYPELAAGLLLLVSARAIVFPSDAWRSRWFLIGLVIGYLPWLHVRFSGVAIVLFAGTCLLHRANRANLAWFTAGFATPLLLLGLFSYQVTGSLNPTSGYFVEGSAEALSVGGALLGGLGYLVDRDWGLFAHAPVFLFALPGIHHMIRRRQYPALLMVAATAVLILTAGAHSLVGAGTTPMRIICAGVPIAIFPMVETARQYGNRFGVRVGFVLALVLSLDTALAYNLHNVNKIRLLDSSVSGWRANLLFPFDSRWAWKVSYANGMVMVLWLVVLAALLCGPLLLEKRRRSGLPLFEGSRLSHVVIAFSSIAAFIVGATIVAAATDGWALQRYQVPPADAATQAALVIDDSRHCSICLASGRRILDTGATLRRLESVSPSVAFRRRSDGSPTYTEWLAMPGRIRAWYIEANDGRVPADTDVGHYLYQWREERVAPPEIRRRIFWGAKRQPPEEWTARN